MKQYRPHLENLENRLTPTSFTLIEELSSLTLSGNVGMFPFEPQDAEGRSLTTTYSGEIVADYDLEGLSLSISAKSHAIAGTSGNWRPLKCGPDGTAPANYGGQVNIFGWGYAAIRDLVGTTYTTEPLSLENPSPGFYTFPSVQMLDVAVGRVDARHDFFGEGCLDIAGLTDRSIAKTAGSLEELKDGVLRLTLSYDVSYIIPLADPPVDIAVRAIGFFVADALVRGGSPSGGSGQASAIRSDLVSAAGLLLPDLAVPFPTRLSPELHTRLTTPEPSETRPSAEPLPESELADAGARTAASRLAEAVLFSLDASTTLS